MNKNICEAVDVTSQRVIVNNMTQKYNVKPGDVTNQTVRVNHMITTLNESVEGGHRVVIKIDRQKQWR